MVQINVRLLIKLILIFLILTCDLPALAGRCEIEVGPGWIKGNASASPLGKVLAQVAEKTGYAIYIDEKLEKAPVTFKIKENLDPEQAIRRIVRPHSYAVVFGSKAKGTGAYILEVRVFDKGQRNTARYVALHSKTGSSRSLSVSGSKATKELTNSSEYTSLSLTASSGYAAEAGRNLHGKNLLRRDLQVKKSIFGTPIIKFRDTRKGPDYRPNAYEMRKAYEQYQVAKKQDQLRNSLELSRRSRHEHEQQSQNYRSQKSREIQHYAKDQTNK